MAKQQKPKVEVKAVESRRANGKAPKKNSKTPVAKGKTTGGYSQAALDRRSARRGPITLSGLTK